MLSRLCNVDSRRVRISDPCCVANSGLLPVQHLARRRVVFLGDEGKRSGFGLAFLLCCLVWCGPNIPHLDEDRPAVTPHKSFR